MLETKSHFFTPQSMAYRDSRRRRRPRQRGCLGGPNSRSGDEHLVSPWLTKIVHYRVNHKLYNAYGKLHHGVHFNSNTKYVGAKRIVQSFCKNIDL